ncbi:MAG: glycerophosphodiester phosphodiesterase [Ktedonobacterales bacterium]
MASGAEDMAGDQGMAAPLRRPYLRQGAPLCFAHRGGAALAPENTLVAYENGLAFGADALELDIHLARDGELMVIHDETLERVTDGTGAIRQYTRDELRHFDAGYRFTRDGGATYPYRGQGITLPTLREVYERFPDTRINIDMKDNDPELEQRLWALLQEFGAEERTLVGSFYPVALARFRRLTAGRVATAAGPAETRNFLLGHLFRATGWLRPAYDALQAPETHRGIRVVSPGSIYAAHRLGLDVHVWTIDDRETMDRLLAWGVDGLMSDRPDVLAQALAAFDHNQ